VGAAIARKAKAAQRRVETNFLMAVILNGYRSGESVDFCCSCRGWFWEVESKEEK
jgi:hypothetical protein